MKKVRICSFALICCLAVLPVVGRSVPAAASASRTYPGERLGAVDFSVSCIASVRAPLSRGVALIHDFWYAEALPQFEVIAKADPECAMAHWGIAMAEFHQIWDRPDDSALARGWQEMKTAEDHPAKTRRERDYIAALADFFRPDARDYPARITEYSRAMSSLHTRYPDDVDAGAFYALSLLAAESPDDTSLTQEQKALAVLEPLFVTHPDHPGVVHYIIHACDTPSLAPRGLAAAERYGQIAPSGPHAVHMPGHIFARLGMWQQDIDANRASVAASIAAESHHMSGAMDQFHSDDFLLYAYLQSAQDDGAAQVMHDADAVLTHFEAMPSMADSYMTGMFPYYKTKYPAFFALETRDWRSAAALEPIETAPPETQALTYWARAIADGHLHHAERAHADIADYDALIERVRKGRHAYCADSTGAKIVSGEMHAWAAFADGNLPLAVKQMRAAADLQDQVGQGEVDIPAREMLADIMLESGQPQEALNEYQKALQQSPGRFNALYNAGRAAEVAGDKPQAAHYYALLLKSTDNGARSARPELDHARNYVAAAKLAGTSPVG
jgi:tetratricopeptide (TPR) repeat protein